MQTISAGLFRDVCRSWPGLAGIALLLQLGAAEAAPWQEDGTLASTLSGTPGYVVNGNSATVTYSGQLATNTGGSGGYFGMYVGWNWLYLGGGNTPLNWDNGAAAFSSPSFAGGGPVSLRISRPGFADQSLRVGDVVGDTWVGVPFSQPGDTPISTSADWLLPLIEFGWIDAGASVSYDIAYEFTFASVAERDSNWNFFTSAQGVRAVPEPSGLALLGVLLLGLGLVRRYRH